MRPTIALVFCLLLNGCDQHDPSEKSEALKRQDEEQALLSDPVRAEPELERRLNAAISVQGRVLIVRDPILGNIGSAYLPANTPWVINCGAGVSVAFASPVSSDGSNEAEVNLSYGFSEQKDCAVIGPQLANRLLDILKSGKQND